MKKGKIFTNCLFSIWTLSVILSFASCSSDGDSISIIDERVPLETEAPFSVILIALLIFSLIVLFHEFGHHCQRGRKKHYTVCFR